MLPVVIVPMMSTATTIDATIVPPLVPKPLSITI